MKKYTLSTMLFDTPEQAVKKMQKFIAAGDGMREGTMILEVSAEIPYDIDVTPVIKLKKAKKL